MSRRLVVPCITRSASYQRHRWETVAGIHSSPEHPYTERRCRRCGTYESEVR